MDSDTAFSVIQQALEAFDSNVRRARDEQAASEEQIASVEYELDQMKKLIAENALGAKRRAA
jgi:septal ring factor EnvC (AmiA/AmiB activator)